MTKDNALKKVDPLINLQLVANITGFQATSHHGTATIMYWVMYQSRGKCTYV